ncbi:Aspartyl/Asparaginyl beta-hydroxylase family protein [Acanthocheilonema viteae]
MSSSTQAQLRFQFKRQAAVSMNGAGHVAPMAVMVASSKVDYSVTKGGLRLWAVLLVFVILCSSFYTLFSTMESTEVAFEIDGDENLDYDGDIDDDADEMAIHNRRAEKDTTPSREYISRSRTFEENRKAHQSIQNMPDSTDDDRLDDEVELEEEEEARLADLRAKAERKSKKALDENVEHDDSDNIHGGNNESDDSDVDKKSERAADRYVKEEEEEKKDRTSGRKEQDKPKRAKARHKRFKVMNDNDNDDDNADEEEEKEKKMAKKEKEGEEERRNGRNEKEIQIEDSTEREKESGAESEGEEKSKDEFGRKKKSRIKSRKKISSMEKLKRECKRKNCLPEYDRHPRMSLLKQIPLSISNRNKPQLPTDSQLTDNDKEQDENDKKEDEENEEDEIILDLAATKKEKLNDRSVYKRHAITNREDHKYQNQLDRADYLVEKHDYHSAIAIFENVLRANPNSPRAHFGIARANDIRSEIESDHSFLNIAINEYQEVLDMDDTPDALFNQAAYRLIDRARFLGLLHRVLQAQRSLIDRYPDDLQLYNNQGLTFLMMGREDDARRIFENVLKISPTNGVAQAYFGYILKLSGDFENGVLYMRKGLRGVRDVIADPRFYYHFGEALTRLGKKQEAYRVYSIGAKIGLFPSSYQRSLYNVEGLTARPWWTIEQTFCSKHLRKIERQWTVIREEAVAILNNHPYLFEPENEELTVNGQWSAYLLYSSNSWNSSNCLKAPKTCDIMRMFKDSSDCLKSEIKFSLLTSGARVWPHCGYSNYRLQAHLGLIISSEARLRVGHEVRGWKTGRFLIFDDSFEQELWFEGASANKYRLILRMDLWHPEMDPVRRVEFRSV